MSTEHQTTSLDFLQGLNPVQYQAVTAKDGPVLVVAGPGSGKTRVLTYRVAYLIAQGVKPWEILTLTFTNKAAREMKERIEKAVGKRAQYVWAGTFHSIFGRILRVESETIGFPSNFTIYDTDDTKSLISTIIKEMNLDKNQYNVGGIRTRISSAKSNIISPKLYAQDEELMQQDRLNKRPHLHKIYAEYVKRCQRAGAMDFDDLLYQLFKLLYTDQDIRKKYQDKFKHVLVDEFQDTNSLQYGILKLLVPPNKGTDPKNIFAVGDDAQSIYAFRGATIENILNFEKDFKGIQVYKLEQNYRSTEHIVQAANEVITYNANQIKKKIWSDKGQGQRIRLIKAMTDTEEGRLIASTVVEQKNRHHLSNSDIAILYRTNAQSRVFEESLRRHNIKYKVFGGLSFYQRKEVKDFIAYLRLTVNTKDEEALRRVINYPRRGIGNTSIEKLSNLASEMGVSMFDAIDHLPIGGKIRNALLQFKEMILHFVKKAQTGNAYEMAGLVVRKCGLIDHLRKDKTIEGMNRVENINSLLDGIKDFVENDEVTFEEGEEIPTDKSLATYLQGIALLTDMDKNEEETDFVTLMSVHSAKGLEFPSVFVVGMEEKLFPSFMSMETRAQLDEERRLFYVAITRAEQFLTLSFAQSRYRYGKMQYNPPSRFLEEINRQHLETSAHISNTRRSSAPQTSGVSGNFRRKSPQTNRKLMADPSTFAPSPPEKIREGQRVLHLRFGEGLVEKIEGNSGNLVATIHFDAIADNPKKKIMLKFAKLEIKE